MPHEIELAPDQIILPTQVRLDNSAGFAEPVLRELGENMRVRQISAVGLRRHETEKNLFLAVYGFRRIRAALLVMLPTIRGLVLEDGLSASEIKIIQLNENLKRHALTEQEVYLACKELMALNPTWMKKNVADALNVDPSMIARILSIDELIPQAREAFLAGSFGFAISYEISHESEMVQHELLAARLNGNATREDLKAVRMRARNGKGFAEKVTKIKCIMDGGVIQISGKEIDLEAAIDVAQSFVKRAKKAVESGWNAKTLEQACKAEAGGK